MFALRTAFAVGVFRKHAEVFLTGFLIDPVVIFVLVTQVCEVGVLPACDFRTDTDDDGLADIGTDIRDTGHVGEQVLEVGVEEDVAGAASHAGKVAFLELQDHIRGDLAQRLDPVSCIDVALFEGQLSLIQDLFQKFHQDVQIAHGGSRKGHVFVGKPPCVIGNIDSMVAQALELREDPVILIEDARMQVILQVGQQRYQIGTDAVRELIDIDLVLLDLIVDLFIVIREQSVSQDDILFGKLELCQKQIVAAAQGDGRCIEEIGVEGLELLLIFLGFRRLILDKSIAELLQKRDHGEDEQGADDIEDGIGVGDQTGVDHLIPETIQKACIMRDRNSDQDIGRLDQVVSDVDSTYAAGIRAGTDGTYDGCRHTVAEIDTDDDGIDAVPDQKA